MIFLIVVLSLLLAFYLFNSCEKRSFVRLFSRGNVMVSGLRGRGKDLAFCVVINARKRNYISNVQYSKPTAKFQRFEFDTKVWELSGNTYTDLVDGSVKPYVYPYPDGIDYYISDAGIYFPAQYQNELCKRYRSAPMFQALSRHLGDCNIHCNSQKQNRVWDKIREQSDLYVVMTGAHWFPRFFPFLRKCFLLTSRIYDVEETAEAQLKLPRFGIGKKAREARANFETAHGRIRKRFFFARLPYAYDSRRFKRILENNLKDYEYSEV